MRGISPCVPKVTKLLIFDNSCDNFATLLWDGLVLHKGHGSGGDEGISPDPADAASPSATSRTISKITPSLSNRTLLLLFAGLGSIIFVLTAYGLTYYVEAVPRYASVLLALVVLAALSLAILVAASLVDLYRSARAGLRGARLHRRLVGLLSIIAIIPGVLAFILTITVLRSFSDEYFVDRVSEADLVAKDFANNYLDAESRKMGLQVVQLATDLGLQAQNGLSPQTSPIGFRRYLLGQTILRGFSAVVLMDGQGQIVAEVTPVEGLEYRLPPLSDFEAVSLPGGSPFKFSAHDQAIFDAWYAILRLTGPEEGYLIAYKAENPQLSAGLLNVRQLRDQSKDVRDRLADLTRLLAIGYGLVMLLLLLVAVWIGLLVANTIVGPVRRLATAAVAVSSGDLSSRVDVQKGDGELGELGHAFNDMTEQLEAQRSDLIAAHEQSDARRRFIETVVSGVPAGVLNVSPDGRIALANPSADSILGHDRGRVAGAYLAEVAPELIPLIDQAQGGGGVVRDQIELKQAGSGRIINVRISPDDPERKTGYVITLDDITELVAAQRHAAWGDVARRIAHEIKNPLTPIQLSAERLRRKYGNALGEDREVFDRCTDTIIRHVGDIGRMVNEFSSFARMPKPNKTKEDLGEIVRSASFSFGVAHPEITFEHHMPQEPLIVLCDGRLIGQAVVNLVKNAVESITEGPRTVPGRVVITVAGSDDVATVKVADNGPGLPEEGRARLTEPYMTTRAKGTGLGLAIVRKAVEEHGGTFTLSDGDGDGNAGATACILLPMTESPRRENLRKTRDVLPV